MESPARGTRQGGRRKWMRPLALSLSLLIALLLCEVGLRVFRPLELRTLDGEAANPARREEVHRSSSIPGLDYELAPNISIHLANNVLITTNSLGLRCHEPLPADTPGLFRIALLGDSFAFGGRVAEGDLFTAQLESMLNTSRDLPPHRYEVLNFGVSGYSSQQEALTLEYKVMPLDPDLVIIAYVLNDPETDPVQPLNRHYRTKEWWNDLHLVHALLNAVTSYDLERYGGGNYVKYLHAVDGPKWKSVPEAFDRIAALTNERGIPVALFVFPLLVDSKWGDYEYESQHKQVIQAALDRRFVAVDLLDQFKKYPPQKTRHDKKNAHPNEFGHRLAAGVMYETLTAMITGTDPPAE